MEFTGCDQDPCYDLNVIAHPYSYVETVISSVMVLGSGDFES